MPEHSAVVSPSISPTPQVLTGILDLLKPEDSFSITLFSDAACTPKAFGPVSCVDIPSLKAQVGVRMKREGPTADFADANCSDICPCQAVHRLGQRLHGQQH